MASIVNDPNGRRRVLFIAPDGKRKTLRLGKVSVKQAELVKLRVESLVSSLIVGHSPDDETSRWIASLDETMRDRLAAVGLAQPRAARSIALGAFIDRYLDGRPDLKPRTVVNIQQAKRWLVKFFTEGRELRTITVADAEDWAAFMRKKGLGENTARRHVGRARQLFKAAIRRDHILRNPFEGLAATVRADKGRQFFVTRETIEKVTDVCTDPEWKLLIALSRYGGLRCPSEHLLLKWSDVNWEKSTIRVTSPKTERHEGKGERVIPMFPELRQPLMDVFERAEPGRPFVITRYRDEAANLRTQLLRLIRRAGLTPWPKLWHNLRATRQTELAESYPIHVVCGWIGNSRAVAQEHYLQITDAHFVRATAETEKAAQKAAHRTAVPSLVESKLEAAHPRNSPEKRLDVTPHDSAGNELLPRTGLEPACLAALPPQSSASANFATWADLQLRRTL